MIFMTHEKHGATHAYTETEAASLEKSGWKRDTFEAWGKRTKPTAEQPADEIKRKLGRPAKAH